MKTFLIASLFALSAGLAAAEQVTLLNGEPVTVLQATGSKTSYMASIKTVVEQDTVFSGVQIVKKSDGSCVKIESDLVSISTLKTSYGNIQQPKVDTKESAVACPS